MQIELKLQLCKELRFGKWGELLFLQLTFTGPRLDMPVLITISEVT